MDSGLSLRSPRKDGVVTHCSARLSRDAFYTYMLASRRYGTLYIGITNDLGRRVYEHKMKATPGFTSRYDVNRLVWYEVYDRVVDAIAREKMLKKWRRDWKIRLIEEDNPNWLDLYDLLAQ